MNNIIININGKDCKAKEDESILNIARRNEIFIPALCYLNGCSPTLACRLCMVDIDGKRAYSCNAKAKEGMNVITNTPQIEQDRRAIMQVYNINHPLACGVCDKSGECELQNYTLELSVNNQEYYIKDTPRVARDWGFIRYDPSLCIVCERCITVCKDSIGCKNLKTIPRGGDDIDKEWKEKMPKDAFATWNKLQKSIIGRIQEDDNCGECGECSAVCPTGALVSSDFQYSSNIWELKRIPASNPHSSDCSLMYYNVKQTSTDDTNQKIYKVSNEYNFAPLNAAARYGYDFQNNCCRKNEEVFASIVSSIKKGKVKQIEFTSFITNEEALILQRLKEKYGLKLVNDEAKAYQNFLKAFSKTSGTSLYNSSIDKIKKSNFLVSLGSFLRSDNPNASYALNNALVMNKGAGLYFHPLGDSVVENYSKNFKNLSHKIGSEEAILWFLLDKFAKKEDLNSQITNFLDTFKEIKTKQIIEKIINKETKEEKEFVKEVEYQTSRLYEMMGIQDLEDDLGNLLSKKDTFSLIVGEDLYTHENAQKLASILGLIQKNTPFSVMILPTNTNTLGVSLICELDEKDDLFTLGYNVKGELTLSALGDGDLDMPALNQQEGTFTNMNCRVVPTNVAISHKGYCLNDLANALDLQKKYTIDYTKELPQSKGYKAKNFDELPNYYDNAGVEHRGYLLEPKEVLCEDFKPSLEKFKKISNAVYRANPINQFSPFTNKAHQLQSTAFLHVSQEWLENKGIQDGKTVKLSCENKHIAIKLKKDMKLKGLIPYLPDFDNKIDTKAFFGKRRYKSMSIEEII